MTIQELNAIHLICEIERTQMLTLLALSFQNPQHGGYYLNGNSSNFLYVERSTAWLYDSPQLHSLVFEADTCFDSTRIYHQNNVKCIDLKTRQTFDYTTTFSWQFTTKC